MTNFKMFSCGALAVTALVSFGLTASSAQAASIVTNGGFELPVLPNSSFLISNTIPGWTRGAGSSGSGIEVQRNNIAGLAFEGQQFAELDSDGVTSIFQDLATNIGQQYRLNFAFSARPNVGDNQLDIGWGGNPVASLSASGQPGTVWNQFSYLLTATNNTTRLSFGNLGETSDSLGSYLDAVSVTAVPTPALLPGLVGLGIAALRKRKAEATAESEA